MKFSIHLIVFLPYLFRDELINEEIKEDKNDPKEPSHHDYKYLRSKAGPLYQLNPKENDEVPLV